MSSKTTDGQNSIVDRLSFTARTAKRATWEAFEFTIRGKGDIEVVNGSYENPEEHTYTVHVEGDIPSDCTCPAWDYGEGACKHIVAVAIREPVLAAVSAEPSMRADGGMVKADGETNERPADCDCEPFMAESSLPCWPCYREGFEEPNPNVEAEE